MSIVLKLRGFQTLGNTCYMNSALQALLSSNIINTVILFYVRKNPDCINNLSPILLEYCRIIIELAKSDSLHDMTYRPNLFKNILGSENIVFRGNGQHDSNELLLYMINEFADDKRDKGMSNLIKRVCFGKFKQYLFCSECKNISESYFKFLDVILPIPSTSNPDLEECFKKFAKYELMDGDSKIFCSKCNKKVIGYKKMEIQDVPDVAIFTFNRFIGTTKNNTPIRIYQYIELEGKKLKLIATVNHYGGTGGGHYIAHVTRNDKWYSANDSNIQDSRIESILNDPSVYLVIYQMER